MAGCKMWFRNSRVYRAINSCLKRLLYIWILVKGFVIKYPGVLIPFVFFVFVMYWVLIRANYWPFNNKTISEAGAFGSSFGALSALFSALAFSGLLWSIFIQIKNLEATQKSLRVQQFESMFMHQIDLHLTVVSRIRIPKSHFSNEGELQNRYNVHSDTEAFEFLYRYLRQIYRAKFDKINYKSEYDRLYKVLGYFKHQTAVFMTTYIRSVTSLLGYISESGIDNREKYVKIFQSYLSDHEIVLLFYWSLTVQDSELYSYLVYFDVLDSVPKKQYLNEVHLTYFPFEDLREG